MIVPAAAENRLASRRMLWCVLLVAAPLAVFGQTASFGFVNFDDPEYVSENVQVKQGLTVDGVRWAFTTGTAANWHPLVWLSLMLDVSLFGVEPGRLHAVSTGFHVANTLLLFAFLSLAAGSVPRAGVVALLWSVHPLRVESVAWISERKDVLFAFFGLICLLCYTAWAQRKGKKYYWLALASFALGLMCKQMLVTLPFVLLLLDVWPLGRRPPDNSWLRLMREKAPFFLLSGVFSVLVFQVQDQAGAVSGLRAIPFSERIPNVLYGYGAYLVRSWWPANLSVFYPSFRHGVPGTQLWLAVAVLGLTFVGVWRLRRSQPAVLVGWLWFLGALFPVSGIVPIGAHQRADRYLYWPHMGLIVAFVWLLAEAQVLARFRRLFPVPIAAASLALMAIAAVHAATFRGTIPLFEQSLRAAPLNNDRALINLGIEHRRRNNLETALQYYARALEIAPNDPDIYYSIGFALQEQGRNEESIGFYRRGVLLLTDSPRHRKSRGRFLNNLGHALRSEALKHPERSELLQEAILQFRRSIEADPEFSMPHVNLGLCRLQMGELDLARQSFERGVALSPENARTYVLLGVVLSQQGRNAEARAAFRTALDRDPDVPEARQRLERLPE